MGEMMVLWIREINTLIHIFKTKEDELKWIS